VWRTGVRVSNRDPVNSFFESRCLFDHNTYTHTCYSNDDACRCSGRDMLAPDSWWTLLLVEIDHYGSTGQPIEWCHRWLCSLQCVECWTVHGRSSDRLGPLLVNRLPVDGILATPLQSKQQRPSTTCRSLRVAAVGFISQCERQAWPEEEGSARAVPGSISPTGPIFPRHGSIQHPCLGKRQVLTFGQ
jgi:hypothetical protein